MICTATGERPLFPALSEADNQWDRELLCGIKDAGAEEDGHHRGLSRGTICDRNEGVER